MQWLPSVLVTVVCLGLSAIMLIPFLWMLSTSLMDEIEVFSDPPRLWPAHPSLENYVKAFHLLPFGRFFANTAIMAAGIVFAQVLTCSMAAYAFARLRFRGRDTLFGAYLSTMMVPQVITLVPAYLIVQSLGWIDTYWALILPFAHSAWGTFLLRQFFLTVPRELEQAARMDGASEWVTFTRVLLPLARPALATLAMFAFISSWQAFLWPLIVTDSMAMRPVEVGAAMFQTMYARNWPCQMAAAVAITLPLVLAFGIAQRQLLRGIALTGMKG